MTDPSLARAAQARPGPLLTLVMAAACGLIVANIYYGQPLAGPIAQAVGLPATATGLIVTLTQIGYGLGLLLAVPLADLIENRRLILIMLGLLIAALVGAALATGAAQFLLAALAIGIAASAAQIIVPFAASLAPEAHRGRMVGTVMSGLMIGIMLARPVASLLAEVASWHLVYWLSTVAMAALAAMLRLHLPERRPTATLGYPALIASMFRLMRTQPVLRRRTFYQVCQFAAFSLFWTVTPLMLSGPAYGLGQGWIAAFGLAGVAGAFGSPIAGWMADRGLGRAATLAGQAVAVAAFVVTWCAPAHSGLGLGLFTVAAIGLDLGVSMTLVVSQRTIYMLNPAERARMNGIFMATFFAGGAVGSAAGAAAFAAGGWVLASTLGIALPMLGLSVALATRK